MKYIKLLILFIAIQGCQDNSIVESPDGNFQSYGKISISIIDTSSKTNNLTADSYTYYPGEKYILLHSQYTSDIRIYINDDVKILSKRVIYFELNFKSGKVETNIEPVDSIMIYPKSGIFYYYLVGAHSIPYYETINSIVIR